MEDKLIFNQTKENTLMISVMSAVFFVFIKLIIDGKNFFYGSISLLICLVFSLLLWSFCFWYRHKNHKNVQVSLIKYNYLGSIGFYGIICISIMSFITEYNLLLNNSVYPILTTNYYITLTLFISAIYNYYYMKKNNLFIDDKLMNSTRSVFEKKVLSNLGNIWFIFIIFELLTFVLVTADINKFLIISIHLLLLAINFSITYGLLAMIQRYKYLENIEEKEYNTKRLISRNSIVLTISSFLLLVIFGVYSIICNIIDYVSRNNSINVSSDYLSIKTVLAMQEIHLLAFILVLLLAIMFLHHIKNNKTGNILFIISTPSFLLAVVIGFGQKFIIANYFNLITSVNFLSYLNIVFKWIGIATFAAFNYFTYKAIKDKNFFIMAFVTLGYFALIVLDKSLTINVKISEALANNILVSCIDFIYVITIYYFMIRCLRKLTKQKYELITKEE